MDKPNDYSGYTLAKLKFMHQQLMVKQVSAPSDDLQQQIDALEQVISARESAEVSPFENTVPESMPPEQAAADTAPSPEAEVTGGEVTNPESTGAAAPATEVVTAAGVIRPEVPVLRKVPVKFLGNTGEYFSIWIVNLLLTIVTFGIYSAWAKVRTNRYFYGNTEIDGHRFSYLAEPMQILKGRIIAVVLFASYFLAGYFSPAAGVVVALLLALLAPVLIVLSYRFRLRMTAYRNVRFSFRGRIGRAYMVFLVWPIIALCTLYLLLPLSLKKMDQYLLEGSWYGDRQFKPRLNTGEYFGTGFATGAIGFVIMLVGFIAVGASSVAFGQDGSVSEYSVMFGTFALYFLTFIIAGSFYTSRIRNHMFGATQLDGVAKFQSSLKMWELVSLRVTNTLAIICSLGFAIPWAKIRKAQMFSDVTRVDVLAEPDIVKAASGSETDALGEEAANLFDVDIALG